MWVHEIVWVEQLFLTSRLSHILFILSSQVPVDNAKIAAHVAVRPYSVKLCNNTLENKHSLQGALYQEPGNLRENV